MDLLELELTQTHVIQKPMLRIEVFTRALRASQNVKKDARFVCSLCLSGYTGVFSEDVGWLAFFVWRPPSGVEKYGKMCKAPRNHKVRGRAPAMTLY